MISKYENYKDSGVEWIGEIPEGWEINALKRGYSVRLGKMLQPQKFSLEDELLPYLRAANIQWVGIDFSDLKSMWFSPIDRQQFALQYGDLLVSEGGDVGRSAILRDEIKGCFFQNSINRIRASEENSTSYLYYWMSVIKDKGYIDVLCNKSTIAHFTAEKVQAVPVPFPSLPEQTTIATFLDRKTAEIDQLIANKESLISLYEEEKTAIINRAVTRGLDPTETSHHLSCPNYSIGHPYLSEEQKPGFPITPSGMTGNTTKLKPSGVDWLGDTPEHWEVKRLKYFVSKVGSGVTPKGGANVYQLDGVPLLRSQNIHFSGLKMDDVAYISNEVHDDMANSKVMPGDVLLNITGASIGRCYFTDEFLGEANVNQHVCIIRPMTAIVTKFLYYQLRSNVGQKQIDIEQTGSGREGLNFESLKNFTLSVPTAPEQTAIVTHIETECARLDAIIEKFKKQIELFKEYRTTLISEVVTGKIDVRGEVES